MDGAKRFMCGIYWGNLDLYLLSSCETNFHWFDFSLVWRWFTWFCQLICLFIARWFGGNSLLISSIDSSIALLERHITTVCLLVSVIILSTELFFTFLVHSNLFVCFKTVYLVGLMRHSSFSLLHIKKNVTEAERKHVRRRARFQQHRDMVGPV